MRDIDVWLSQSCALFRLYFAICLHIGRFEEARIAHEHALKSNPKNVSSNLEFIDLYSGDFAGAKETGEVWCRKSPGNKLGFYLSSHALLLAADLDAAGHRLAMALEKFPDEPLFISLQGMLHARRGEFGAAASVRTVLRPAEQLPT